MCGLVGVMGKTLTEPCKKMFYDMLQLDALRGDDSTGVAAISNYNTDKLEVEMFKSLGGPSEFFYDHSVSKKSKALTYKPVNIFIGHNRYATQGKVTTDNAHPFEFDNVVGAHNGTLYMPSLKEFHGFKDHDVDSKIIYSQLSHTRDINSVWKDAEGAMALTWFDKVSRKFHIIRNKERPLFFAYSKNDEQLFWASEEWMLLVGAIRQNVELLPAVSAKPDIFYTFSINDAGKIVHEEEAIAPFVPKPVIYYPKNHNGYRGYHNYLDDWDDWGMYNQGGSAGYKNHTPPPTKKLSGICLISEFHDFPHAPAAVGYVPSGKLIKINIPIAKYREAKDKLLGIDKNSTFLSIKKYHQSVTDKGNFWCNWEDVNMIKLKPHMQIVRKSDNSFSFVKKEEVNLQYAPSFNSNVFMTLSSYVNKTACGCLNCEKVPIWAERDTLKWIDNDKFVCKDCLSLDYVQELIA